MKNLKQKTIVIYPLKTKLHSIYNPTINLFNKRYTLIYNPQQPKQRLALLKILKNPKIRGFYRKFIRKYFSPEDLRVLSSKREKAPPNDIIFSSNKMPPFKGKFIIDLENVTAISGYDYSRLDKGEVSRRLSDKDCKAIIVWSDFTKKALIKTLDNKSFVKKIKVLPFGITSQKINKNFHRKSLNLLFVSSTNNPLDFELKGGIIALEVYSKLIKKYPGLKFNIRAYAPPWIKKKYGGLKGLNFIEEFLPTPELNKLLLESDILLEPMAGIGLLLECMDYAIPAIIFDYWSLPEMAIHNKNGFVVDSSNILGDKRNLEEYQKNFHIKYMDMYQKVVNPKILEDFYKYTEKLIIDKALRVRMAKYAKNLVKTGNKFSWDKREKAIKSLVDKSLK